MSDSSQPCPPSQAKQKSHIDDEYARAGEEDPRILITTARDASSRLTQFAKELRLVFPNAQRINRGENRDTREQEMWREMQSYC